MKFPTNCGINKFQNKVRSLTENEDESSVMDVLRRILGLDDQEKRIMGGKPARPGSHPWIVYFSIPLEDGSAAGVSKTC